MALVYSQRFNSPSQGRALGSESTALPSPPRVKTDSASVCCRNPTADVEKPQTVLLVLASPVVQMVRDKWRRRKRSDQLKGNVIPSRSVSPSSEAANCSLCCAGGWVPGGRLLPPRRGLPGCIARGGYTSSAALGSGWRFPWEIHLREAYRADFITPSLCCQPPPAPVIHLDSRITAAREEASTGQRRSVPEVSCPNSPAPSSTGFAQPPGCVAAGIHVCWAVSS